MTLARTAKRRDANEREIVSALRAIGAYVWTLDTPVDLLVGFRGAWHVVEVKCRASRGKLTPAQAEMVKLATNGAIPPVHVVWSVEDAVRAIGAFARVDV